MPRIQIPKIHSPILGIDNIKLIGSYIDNSNVTRNYLLIDILTLFRTVIGEDRLVDITSHTHVIDDITDITGTPDGSKFLRDDGIWTSIPGGGDALVANPLSQFAATTKSQLDGVISDGNVMYIGDVPTSHVHTFASLTSKPTTISSYGITDYNSLWDNRLGTKSTTDLSEGSNLYYTDARVDANSLVVLNTAKNTNVVQTTIVGISGTKAEFDTELTDGNFMFIGDSPTSHTHTFASLTSKPTTISGYGITDYNSLWDTRLGTKSTTNLSEGSNLYYTDARVKTHGDTLYSILAHTHVLSAGATDVTATAAELNLLDLAGLTTGWVLSADSSTTASWKAPTGGSGDVATDAIWDAVGDLVVGSGADTASRLAIGTGLQVLRVNSGATGLEWSTPAGVGDMVLADPQTVSGVKTFLDTTMKLRNVANTFDGYFVNTNTVNRIYTLQDAAGIIAFTSDITGTNSGTNTGDNSVNSLYSGLVSNVSTALSVGTRNATTFGITSDGGSDDVVLLEATTSLAGLLGSDKWDEIVANTAKAGNIATSLSIGTITATTFGITSDGGANDIILPEANTTQAGLLGSAKWNEIVANNAKVTNVNTDLSMGTVSGTQYTINSSDGNNVNLPLADTNNWGIISDEIFDEIVANNAKVSNIVQTDLSSISDTKSNFNASLSDGSFIFVGDAPTSHTHTVSDITDYDDKLGITIENPSGTEDISIFPIDRAITITKIVVRLIGSSTPSVTWTIRHGTDRSATGVEVVTGGTTSTTVTTGQVITTFNDATIIANSAIWLETTAKSGTVTEINLGIYYTID